LLASGRRDSSSVCSLVNSCHCVSPVRMSLPRNSSSADGLYRPPRPPSCECDTQFSPCYLTVRAPGTSPCFLRTRRTLSTSVSGHLKRWPSTNLPDSYQTASQDGARWCFVMAGNVSGISVQFTSSDRSIDFILAACDVEGNFMVVKAFQYTNLLSCMLLDAWVHFSWSELPVLNTAS